MAEHELKAAEEASFLRLGQTALAMADAQALAHASFTRQYYAEVVVQAEADAARRRAVAAAEAAAGPAIDMRRGVLAGLGRRLT